MNKKYLKNIKFVIFPILLYNKLIDKLISTMDKKRIGLYTNRIQA